MRGEGERRATRHHGFTGLAEEQARSDRATAGECALSAGRVPTPNRW